MQNENIFEVNETKSVNITENQLFDLMVKATRLCIKESHEYVVATGKEEPEGMAMMYLLMSADFCSALKKILFEDSDT